jgi:plastocyanin
MNPVLTRRRAVLAGAIATVTLLSACGAAADTGTAGSGAGSAAGGASAPTMDMTMPMTSTSGASSAAAATNKVAIVNYAFGPQTVTVKAGSAVTWTQQDEDSHTVTADNTSFASPTLTNGQTYSHTFTAAGTYSYHCAIHPYMHGTVVVTNG